MTQVIRLWEITNGDNLEEVSHSKLNWEERIENWLEKDISIISNNLLVIGRQVGTDFGGVIDILCLDSNGDIVIVELKRDKTPRDITAQVLDYGSWVKDLTYENVSEIGNAYYCNKTTLEEAFRDKFGGDYPEIINESHRMLIVASMIDSSSDRIIKYLSDSYGVGINAITFNYYKSEDGKEYLSRVFLLDPLEAKPKEGKRSKSLSFEQFQEMAVSKGVGELYSKSLEKLKPLFYTLTRHITGISLQGRIVEQNSIISLVVIYPYYSDPQNGLKLTIYLDRLTHYFQIDKEKLINSLPHYVELGTVDNVGDVGSYYLNSEADIDRFVSVLKKE